MPKRNRRFGRAVADDLSRFALVVDCAGDGCAVPEHSQAECDEIEAEANEGEGDIDCLECLNALGTAQIAQSCCEQTVSTLAFCGEL